MVTAVSNDASNSLFAPETNAQQRIDDQYNDFLNLLTTQLQNQDPTDPADTNQLTSQIAALSQVEQQIATNDLLEQLVSSYQDTQVGTAVSYIGRQVDAPGNSIALTGGAALIAYELESAATDTTITITDEIGATVFTSPVTGFAGRQQLIWDGSGNNGQQLPDGVYKFSISAENSSGDGITATTYTTGIVSSVDLSQGDIVVAVGDLDIPINDIVAVRSANLAAPSGEEQPANDNNEGTDSADNSGDAGAGDETDQADGSNGTDDASNDDETQTS